MNEYFSSTYLSLLSYWRTTPTINLIFLEDLVRFNSSITLIKCVFFSLRYSFAKSTLKYNITIIIILNISTSRTCNSLYWNILPFTQQISNRTNRVYKFSFLFSLLSTCFIIWSCNLFKYFDFFLLLFVFLWFI